MRGCSRIGRARRVERSEWKSRRLTRYPLVQKQPGVTMPWPRSWRLPSGTDTVTESDTATETVADTDTDSDRAISDPSKPSKHRRHLRNVILDPGFQLRSTYNQRMIVPVSCSRSQVASFSPQFDLGSFQRNRRLFFDEMKTNLKYRIDELDQYVLESFVHSIPRHT